MPDPTARDVVERLRSGYDEITEIFADGSCRGRTIAPTPDMIEAADEIERLRSELEAARTALDTAERFMRAAIANVDNRAIQGNLANSRLCLDKVRAALDARSALSPQGENKARSRPIAAVIGALPQ